jgi:hypothetical protein
MSDSPQASPMPRRLLNIASIACLVACVALLGMWVRSYRDMATLRGSFFSDRQLFAIHSVQGRLLFVEVSRLHENMVGRESRPDWPWEVSHSNDDSLAFYLAIAQSPLAGFGFTAYESKNGFGEMFYHPLTFPRPFWCKSFLMIPYWFLVLASGTLAMLCQIRWPGRFTLRSLFIATTFVAIVLGMIAWLDRAWIGK